MAATPIDPSLWDRFDGSCHYIGIYRVEDPHGLIKGSLAVPGRVVQEQTGEKSYTFYCRINNMRVFRNHLLNLGISCDPPVVVKRLKEEDQMEPPPVRR